MIGKHKNYKGIICIIPWHHIHSNYKIIEIVHFLQIFADF